MFAEGQTFIMARRSKAREMALQMLYQKDLNSDIEPDIVRKMIIDQLTDEDLSRFAWSLFAGVTEIQADLDDRIQSISQNWKLARMAPTDRNVLRLGAFELLQTDTPAKVVIDEAVELAKLFGNKNSSQFVNGILDKLIPEEKREAEQTQSGED